MEVWKDIKGYIGYYQVSNHGRLKSLKRHNIKEDHIVEGHLQRGKYRRVTLSKDGEEKQFTISHLVLAAFKNELRAGEIALHLDGDTTHDIEPNLECSSKTDAAKYRVHVLKKGNKSNKIRGAYKNTIPGCHTKKWRSVIKNGKKRETIGYYKSKRAAHKAYFDKYVDIHGYAPWRK